MRKICSCCSSEKFLIDFPKDKRSKDGVTTVCKLCTNIRNSQRRKENLSKYKETEKAYREKHYEKLSASVKRCKEKYKDDLQHFSCEICNSPFTRAHAFRPKNEHVCCSYLCLNIKLGKRVQCKCENCGKDIVIVASRLRDHKHNFCSMSCSGYWAATNKTNGITRSKFELFLEEQIKIKFPTIAMSVNDHETINSELDFYFPDLRFAIEVNGIFHYEPIFGGDTLEKIKNNDQRKFQACLENEIELFIINASTFRSYRRRDVQDCLSSLFEIIEKKINP